MNNFSFHSPTKVIFGKGVADQIGAETKAWGGTKVRSTTAAAALCAAACWTV